MSKKILLRTAITICLLVLFDRNSFSNNISVTSISLSNPDIQNHYVMVKFNLQWENSWRTSSAPNNWDAAWVFVKYRVNSGLWLHAWLNNAGHYNPSGSTIATGLLNPALPFDPVNNPGMGVFIYRDADGTGTFSNIGVQLRWNYGANGLNDNDKVDIRLYAIEQVYVPQGSFYAGSGGTEISAFYKYPVTSNPYQVTSENEIPVGATNDYLYYNYSAEAGDRLGPIPAAFPKGYKAFYCMKYEISQQGYVDFLNSLSTTQANSRFYNSGNTYRNGISRNNGIFSTSNPYVACNYLNWADITAYFDWSGLRPITELEFEKACRGTVPPVPNECAWGNANVTSLMYTLGNSGASNEFISSNFSTTSGNAAYDTTTPRFGSINGPLRAGIFAGTSGNSGRVSSGATYYGIMEMSGNLLEHFVTVGNPAGRLFTGNHGNGLLTASGNPDVSGWPDITSLGAGFRGGYWYYYAWYLRVSERVAAAGTDAVRYNSDGGRGGRTAPL